MSVLRATYRDGQFVRSHERKSTTSGGCKLMKLLSQGSPHELGKISVVLQGVAGDGLVPVRALFLADVQPTIDGLREQSALQVSTCVPVDCAFPLSTNAAPPSAYRRWRRHSLISLIYSGILLGMSYLSCLPFFLYLTLLCMIYNTASVKSRIKSELIIVALFSASICIPGKSGPACPFRS